MRLGIEKPQLDLNEEDDEWTEFDEVQHCVAESVHQSKEQVQVEDITDKKK